MTLISDSEGNTAIITFFIISLRTQIFKYFSNTCIYLGNKDQVKDVASTFTVVGNFAEYLVIL